MPLSAELELALLTGSGDIGQLLGCVSAYEVGQLDALKSVGGDLSVMWELYLEALKWADLARHSMISV
jgi:c-di-GMP-related signal transduction protein